MPEREHMTPILYEPYKESLGNAMFLLASVPLKSIDISSTPDTTCQYAYGVSSLHGAEHLVHLTLSTPSR